MDQNNSCPKTSPTPWHFERREFVYRRLSDKQKRKRVKIFLVDADGKDVWMTEANARLICECVNVGGCHAQGQS